MRQHPGVDIGQRSINTPGVSATTSVSASSTSNRSSLLAELIQAVGIGPENIQTQGEEIVLSEESSAVASLADSQRGKYLTFLITDGYD